MKNIIALIGLSLFLCQCSTTKYTGNAPNPPLEKLAIVKNDKLHMSGMQPEVVKQVQEMGIQTTLVDSPPATGAYMIFTARWRWDMAMYLSFFEAHLYQNQQKIAGVRYVTSGLDMGKFGHTDNKIRPMLRKLLLGVNPPPKPREPAPSMR